MGAQGMKQMGCVYGVLWAGHTRPVSQMQAMVDVEMLFFGSNCGLRPEQASLPLPGLVRNHPENSLNQKLYGLPAAEAINKQQ